MFQGDFPVAKSVPLLIPPCVRREWQMNGVKGEFLAQAEDELEQNNWIGKEWDGWSGEQRMAQVKEEIFKCGGMGWHGTNLRKLRSTLVEEWLASPEPPRRSPRGIPRQVSKKAGGEWGSGAEG